MGRTIAYRGALLVFGVLWEVMCSAGFDEHYVTFKTAFAANRPLELSALAVQLEKDPDQRLQRLGALAEVAQLYRADEVAACQERLTILGPMVPPNDALLRGLVLKFQALVAQWYAEPLRSVIFCEEGLALLDPSTFPEERVDLLVIKAESLRDAGQPDEAIGVLGEAQAAAERADYKRGQCLVRINLGNIRFDQQRYAEAWTDYTESLRCAASNGFDMITQNSINNLGSAAVMLKRYDVALRAYDSLLVVLGDRSPELRARLLSQKGFIATEQGDHTRALAHYRSALALHEMLEDRTGKIKTTEHMATSVWELGRRDEAIRLMSEALQGAADMNLRDIELELHSYLGWWYQQMGRYRESCDHKDREMILSDSLHVVRFNERSARAEALFETQRKEFTIKEQEQALLTAALDDRRKSLQLDLAVGATLALLVIAVLLWRGLHTRKQLARRERELHAQRVDELLREQELRSINAMLEGQEQERDRLAKDLHDRLGSMLSAIKHQLGAVEEEVHIVRQDQSAQYSKVHRMLDDAVGEVRRISHDMVTVTLARFGLEKALEDLCATVRVNGKLAVESRFFGLEKRMERSLEIVVYRIIQELISNVLKHAHASELSVTVTRETGRLSVMVSDDGRGFDVAEASSGIGMQNVRSRAASIGAVLRVDSTIGKGTTVSIEAPVLE